MSLPPEKFLRPNRLPGMTWDRMEGASSLTGVAHAPGERGRRTARDSRSACSLLNPDVPPDGIAGGNGFLAQQSHQRGPSVQSDVAASGHCRE